MFAAFEALLTFGVAAGALLTPLAIDLLGSRSALVAVGLVAPVAVAARWAALRRLDARMRVRDADVAILHEVPMLRALPQATIEQLAAALEHAEIAPGRPVFEQGERGERFFVVEAGRAEVLRDHRSVATLGRGDCFGEIALLRDCVRTATVRASADAPLRVSVLPRDPFLTAVTGYPASAMAGEHVVRARLEALALPPIQSAAEPGYNGADGGGCDGPGTGRRPLIHVAVTRRRIVSCSGSSAGRLAVARRAALLRPSLPVCASCASHAG